MRIRGIGIHRTEITLRSGRSPVEPRRPAKLGFEAAGEIEAIGAGVKGFAIGDRVALVPAYPASRYGLYGESSLAPARSLIEIPDAVNFEQAAATWAAYGTAWAGLVAFGRLAAGQTVLLPAASRSVGLAAIRFANRLGARPIALTRTSVKAYELRAHEAAAIVATEEQDVVSEIKRLTDGKGAGLVFDPVGGPTFAKLVEATASGGLLILYGALSRDQTAVPPFHIFVRNLTIRGVALPVWASDEAQFGALKRFVTEGLADGSLSPVIARIFPFDDIVEAHRFMEAGNHVGNIVVTVCPPQMEINMPKTTPEQNKALVLEAFDTSFNKRDNEAAARFWSDTYILHSAHIEPGRDGLFNLVSNTPGALRYEHQLIVAEGDYVIVHGRFSGTGGPASWVAADIFRIENGRLAERWDVLQDEATKAESKSALPMFGNRFTA
ncbi:MAG TPA: zinc-binding dehydrogenase [Bryobacteraceae bacterium]|jgi:NADPH:quinone reductase-like Zn-dependent oxidoreductase/predicted SnoaL-like aldol condensation-catalyzing enzyme|nr:zinc-binding dehydrogenase [Bryobacteraceae bacterium]